MVLRCQGVAFFASETQIKQLFLLKLKLINYNFPDYDF